MTPKPRSGRKARKRVYVIGTEAFVQHPIFNGLWIRTHISVVKIACEHCRAAIDEPCRTVKDGNIDYHSYTHYRRRGDAKRMKPDAAAIRMIIA